MFIMKESTPGHFSFWAAGSTEARSEEPLVSPTYRADNRSQIVLNRGMVSGVSFLRVHFSNETLASCDLTAHTDLLPLQSENGPWYPRTFVEADPDLPNYQQQIGEFLFEIVVDQAGGLTLGCSSILFAPLGGSVSHLLEQLLQLCHQLGLLREFDKHDELSEDTLTHLVKACVVTNAQYFIDLPSVLFSGEIQTVIRRYRNCETSLGEWREGGMIASLILDNNVSFVVQSVTTEDFMYQYGHDLSMQEIKRFQREAATNSDVNAMGLTKRPHVYRFTVNMQFGFAGLMEATNIHEFYTEALFRHAGWFLLLFEPLTYREWNEVISRRGLSVGRSFSKEQVERWLQELQLRLIANLVCEIDSQVSTAAAESVAR